MLDTQMLIGSKFVAGAGESDAVLNPKTEAKIVELTDATPAQVDAAVNAAEKAFQYLVAHDARRALGPPA